MEEVKARADENILRGRTVYKGRVESEAYVDMDCSNPDGINYGQILVTRGSSAEISLYLDKAAAIVTDEGGVTSFGSVHARESSVPCIVGTQDATKRISNGQRIRIEADSDGGRVYLL